MTVRIRKLKANSAAKIKPPCARPAALAAIWGSALPGGVSVAHAVQNQFTVFSFYVAKNLNLNHCEITLNPAQLTETSIA